MGSLLAVHAPPCAKTILAEGELTWIPMAAVAWLTDRNEIAIAVVADQAEIGRRVLIRLWRADGSLICCCAAFRDHGRYAITAAVIGPWDGAAFTALTLYPCMEAGEEA